MSDRGPRVLVTNDDGIDHPGLGAVADALSGAGAVTAVAPAEDRSGVGRQDSYEVTVADHDRGYAVEGTPCDCVRFGLRGLDGTFDVVVSGANDGPNLGAFKLGRSGTIAAAVEAAYLGTPAVAVSAYDPGTGSLGSVGPEQFRPAREVVRHLVPAALETGVFEVVDLLNVHVPTESTDEVRITRPLTEYDIGVDRDGDEVAFEKRFYDPLRSEDPPAALEKRGERDTDRRALADEVVSVAPLTIDRETVVPPELEGIAEAFPAEGG